MEVKVMRVFADNNVDYGGIWAEFEVQRRAFWGMVRQGAHSSDQELARLPAYNAFSSMAYICIGPELPKLAAFWVLRSFRAILSRGRQRQHLVVFGQGCYQMAGSATAYHCTNRNRSTAVAHRPDAKLSASDRF